MKKILIIGCIIGIISISMILNKSYNTYKEVNIGDNTVNIALTLDGSSISDVPSKGNYSVDVSCENATGKWDYSNWKLLVNNIKNANIVCSLDFTTVNPADNYLNNKVTSLVGNGEVFNENGIRYEGMNPNNYVWFNNELWRIIGVFDDTTHGVTGESLVKIIRDESLGVLAWDKSQKNNWATSSLMNLLNGAYLNQEDGTNGDYCYGFTIYAKAHCDYREKGISDEYRNMIETRVVWKLGGIASYGNTALSFYKAERGTTVYNGNATVWPNSSGASYPIGLMYMSDFGYAAPSSYCARTTNLSPYSGVCTFNNWLYNGGTGWTLTHNLSNSTNGFPISSFGNASNSNVGSGSDTRPVLYLKSSAWVISGDGSEANPYIITL